MDRDVERLIEQGIAAARSEYKEQAEQYLRQAVTLDPRNEQAWLWLSAVIEDIGEKRECLRRVLEINPASPNARSGLRFLSHLREGYEYMAARAPWMSGTVEGQFPHSGKQDVVCPRCGMSNPDYVFTCNNCGAPLDQVDVAEQVRRELLKKERSKSVLRPWSSALVLDSTQVFAPEVELASTKRALLSLAVSAFAANMLRFLAVMILVAFVAPTRFSALIDRITISFLGDLVWLLSAGVVSWIVLAAITLPIADSMGGFGSSRIHFYLMGVAISSWMAVSGLVTVIATAATLIFPTLSVQLILALASGLMMFYAITLIAQAIHTAHGLQPLQEVWPIGLILTICVVIYGALIALTPAGTQLVLLKLFQITLFPIAP